MATEKLVSCLQAFFVYLTGGKRRRIGLWTNRQRLWQTIRGGILRIWYVLSNARCGVLGLSTKRRRKLKLRGRKLRLSVHERRGILKVSICNRRRQLRDVLSALSVR